MNSTNLTPPERRSMTDEQIQEALGNAHADEAGITAAMELLETQAQLRDIEKMEFSSWVLEMERLGTPQSLLAIENAKRAQQGLPPVVETAPIAPAPVIQAPIEVAPVEPATIQPAPAEPAPVEPVQAEDAAAVAAKLNELYSSPTPQEVPAPVFAESEFEVTVSNTDLSSGSDLDDFDRLLAAETVVGAEDELTAIEEESVNSTARAASFAPVPGFAPNYESRSDFFNEDSEVVEEVALESAPKAARRSRSSSQFWAWLGVTGSVLPIALAWYANSLGISFSQGVVAIALGTFSSAIVVAVGALAGKRSGLPTLMLSRAAFGVHANAVVATILALLRVLWTVAIFSVLLSVGSEFFKVESPTNVTATNTIYLGVGAIAIAGIAVTLAILGGRVLYRAQQVAGILGVAVVITMVIATAGLISVNDLLAQPTSSWLNVFGFAVLTFSVFGLAWTSTGADFARKLSANTRGASVIGWGILSLGLIPAIIGGYGLALMGSLPRLAKPGESAEMAALPTMFEDLSNALAPWAGYTLLGSALITIIVVLAMSLYSSNLGLHSIGARTHPGYAQPILGLIGLTGAFFAVVYIEDLWGTIAGYAMIAAVPVAAWSGIFITDVLIRRIAYHEISLSRGYGFYKSVNLVNIIGWAISTAIGLGLIYSEQPGFAWTGYLADLMINTEFWASSSFGIVIAFSVACLLPVLFGIPRIKRQESEVLAIESRRDDLKDVLGLAD
jgi:purine-cytosine permease-like protein